MDPAHAGIIFAKDAQMDGERSCLPDQEAGKGVPAAHPYGVGIGCCLFDRLEEVVVNQAENSVVVISSTKTV